RRRVCSLLIIPLRTRLSTFFPYTTLFRSVAGAGVEAPVDGNWTARIEYLYSNFGSLNVMLPSGTSYGSTFDLHTVRLGLNRKLRSEEHTSELQSHLNLVCRLLLEKKKKRT